MDVPEGIGLGLFGACSPILAVGFGILAKSVVDFHVMHMFEPIAVMDAIVTSIKGGVIIAFASAVFLIVLCFIPPHLLRRLVLAYMLVSLSGGLMLLDASFSVQILASQIDNVAEETGTFQNNSQEAQLNDYFVAIYQTCCVEKFNLTIVVPCALDEKVGCIYNQTRYLNFVEDMTETECNHLRDSNFISNIVIADPNENELGCGNGDSIVFVIDIASFFAIFIGDFETTNMIFGLFISLFSCITIFLILVLACEPEQRGDQKYKDADMTWMPRKQKLLNQLLS